MRVFLWTPLFLLLLLLSFKAIFGQQDGLKVNITVSIAAGQNDYDQTGVLAPEQSESEEPEPEALTMTISTPPPPPGPRTVISLFSGARHRGDEYRVRLNGSESHCVNLPDGWRNRAGSIHTHGGCVVVYDEIGCDRSRARGWEKLWAGDDKNHWDLSDGGHMKRRWDGVIESLGACGRDIAWMTHWRDGQK